MSQTQSPGSVLLHSFMLPNNLAANTVARIMGRTKQYVIEILMDARPLSATMADDLATVTGTTPEYWLETDAAWRNDSTMMMA